MPMLSEIIVQELLREGNIYANRYALSVKIAGKDLTSDILTTEEKQEINRILKNKNVPFTLN